MTNHKPVADIAEGWRLVERLAQDVDARVAGTPAEPRAVEVITGALEGLGLQPQVQPFTFIGWEPGAGAELRCTLPDGSSRDFPVRHLGFTQAGTDISGRLVPAGKTQLVEDLMEWPRFAVMDGDRPVGYIAVVEGATRTFIRPERQSVLPLPTLIVGSDTFGAIVDGIEQGEEITARLSAHGACVIGRESANIIVDLPGEAPGEVVIVNGHYDTMPGTPGAGDNASGVGACLALAWRFLQRPHRRTLRFALWGAHEMGLLGSQAYVLDLAESGTLGEIVAAVSLDILSDGDRLGIWTGGSRLDAALASAEPDLPSPYSLEIFPRLHGETDSWSFAERGIDTAMFLTLPYSHYHLPEDTIDNNDPELFAFSVEVADRVIDHLLNDPTPASTQPRPSLVHRQERTT